MAWRWCWRAFFIAGGLQLAMPAYAAPATLTKEQLQLLQQMSPAERDALLRSLQHSPRTANATSSQAESTGMQEPEVPAGSVQDTASRVRSESESSGHGRATGGT